LLFYWFMIFPHLRQASPLPPLFWSFPFSLFLFPRCFRHIAFFSFCPCLFSCPPLAFRDLPIFFFYGKHFLPFFFWSYHLLCLFSTRFLWMTPPPCVRFSLFLFLLGAFVFPPSPAFLEMVGYPSSPTYPGLRAGLSFGPRRFSFFPRYRVNLRRNTLVLFRFLFFVFGSILVFPRVYLLPFFFFLGPSNFSFFGPSFFSRFFSQLFVVFSPRFFLFFFSSRQGLSAMRHFPSTGWSLMSVRTPPHFPLRFVPDFPLGVRFCL